MAASPDDDDAALADELARQRRAKLEGDAAIDVDELRTLLELCPDLVAVTAFDGRFLLLNHAWEATLGHSRAELRAHPFIDFVHPDDRDKTARLAERLQPGAPLLSFQNRYRCKDGSYRPLSWKAVVSPEKGRYYSFARDATELMRARERDALLAAVCEQSRDALLIQAADGAIVGFRGAGERLFGHAEAALLGQPVARFLARDGRGTDLAPLAAEGAEVAAHFLTAAGTWAPVMLAATQFGDGAAGVTGVVATLSPRTS